MSTFRNIVIQYYCNIMMEYNVLMLLIIVSNAYIYFGTYNFQLYHIALN